MVANSSGLGRWVGAAVLVMAVSLAGISKAQEAAPGKSRRVAGDPYFTPSLHRSQQTSSSDRKTPVDSTGQKSNPLRPLIPVPRNVKSVALTPPQKKASELNQSSDFQPRTGSIINEKTTRQPVLPKPAAENQQVNYLDSGKADAAPIAKPLAAFEPGKLLAVVGGEPIFVADLLFEANQVMDRVMPTAPDSVKTQQRPVVIKMLLPKIIDSKILYVSTLRQLPDGVDMGSILEQAGKEFDDKALPALMEDSGVQSPAMFDAHLRLMGSSLRKMRENWSKEQLTKYFLGQQLNIEVEVTHQEMLEYYQQHATEYAIQSRAQWEQVMVRFDRFSSRSQAKKAIVEMGNQIVYGAQLEAVAKRSSQGFLADQGGQYDWTNQGSLAAKTLDDAIFSLPVGELSDIIETRDGYHIIRVKQRQAANRKPFLEAQVEIKQAIEKEKREAAFQEHLAKLRREIPVEIFDFAAEDMELKEKYTLQR